MRVALAAALILLPSWLAGCDRLAPGAEGTVFEARCQALPGIAPTVVALPITPHHDESRSLAELTGMFDRARPAHETMGLTQARIGFQSAIDVKGLKETGGRRVCVRAQVRVEMVMQPLTVFVAHEVARDECRRAAVREHEMKHVAVYEAYMRDAVARLARTLPEALPERVHYAADAATAQADLARALSAYLEQFQAQDSDEIAARQAEVDSAPEYARVAAACAAPG
ncbi:MAG: hypothetical protein ABI593_09140 [Betaproteobacteria bacterium]